MDFAAVVQASDDILNNLGLVKKGDILSLRGFCEGQMKQKAEGEQKDARDETKRKLLAELFDQKRKKSKKSQDGERGRKREEQPKKKAKSRRIQLGWLHFDEHSRRFVAMRLNRGGGTRELDVPLSADVCEMIQIAQDIFFPDGRSTFGNLSDMDVDLANFKCDKLENSMPDGEPLTLQRYIDACKATRIRLYIQTKSRNSGKATTQDVQSAQKEEEFDDNCLLVPTFDAQRMNEPSGSLIGSSKEREQLRKEQETELLESLTADQDRRHQLCDEIQRTSRQLRLREARSARVEPEPDQLEPKINVSVRHLLLGVVSRPFHLRNMMSAVYDWIGSLSVTPEHFTLCGFDGKCLLPSESVRVAERTMLYMTETDDAPDLTSEDSEINFQGFGSSEPNLDNTLPLTSSMSQPSTSFDVSPIPERPPEQLFQEHDSLSPDSSERTTPEASSSAGPSRYSTGKRSRNEPGRLWRMMVNSSPYADGVGNERLLPMTRPSESQDSRITVHDSVTVGVGLGTDPVGNCVQDDSEETSLSVREGAYREYLRISEEDAVGDSDDTASFVLEEHHDTVAICGTDDTTTGKEQRTKLQEELRSLVSQLLPGCCSEDPMTQQLINIRRSRLWEDARRAFSSPSFSMSKGIRVNFIGEPAVDGGGPRREFYRLLVEAACTTSGLLEGSEGRKLPMHNCAALRGRKFCLLGIMAGMSMIDGGPGLPVFAAPAFNYIATDNPLGGDLEDIPDSQVRSSLLNLNSVESTEAFRNMVSKEEFEFFYDCGYSKPLASCDLTDRSDMLECVILHFTHYRIRAELDQIKEGLAQVGILQAIKSSPAIFKPLLCADRRLEITAEFIRELFVPSLSEVGSNARRLEEDLLYNWAEYLKEMEYDGRVRAAEAEVTLRDLFIFLTGSESIPPMGFVRKGSINFAHQENPEESRFPSVSTCLPQLQIPVCHKLREDYDIFKEQMNLAILGSVGFGQL